MNDEDVYKIAEYIAYNREEIIAFIPQTYRGEQLLDKVIDVIAIDMPQYNRIDIECAFDDTRVMTVYDFYFTKERKELH